MPPDKKTVRLAGAAVLAGAALLLIGSGENSLIGSAAKKQDQIPQVNKEQTKNALKAQFGWLREPPNFYYDALHALEMGVPDKEVPSIAKTLREIWPALTSRRRQKALMAMRQGVLDLKPEASNRALQISYQSANTEALEQALKTLDDLRRPRATRQIALDFILDAARREPEPLNLNFADLAGLNLPPTGLRNADLRGTFLVGQDMQRFDLTGARLYGTLLTDANLRGARLGGAKLTGALHRTDLSQTILRDAAFGRASLRGTRLNGADITGADFSEASGLTEAQLAQAHWIRLENVRGQGRPKLPDKLKSFDLDAIVRNP